MYLTTNRRRQAAAQRNTPMSLPAPVGGINAYSSIMEMPPTDAVYLENFIPYPGRLTLRDGCVNWTTGFANTIYRLWNYSSPAGVESLWATTDAGVYNATSAGAVGAAAIALTNGKTIGAIMSTGASNYLTLVNGTDDAKQYDGTTWSSIATFGATNSNTLSYVEVYRGRIFFAVKNSLNLIYLASNAITGASTVYGFAGVFRRGGYIVAMGTWTIDGGTGPDDNFVIVTSMGEVAVFNGADPASWSFKGLYFIGKPLGQMPLSKYGGDLLLITETGLYPLSSALQVATIDRTQAISKKIQQLFTEAGREFSANHGWQIIAQPDIPLIIVNVPSTPVRAQYCMHPQTGAWTLFTGWEAQCFGRLGNAMFFAVGTKTAKITGHADFSANIYGTFIQAYTQVAYPRNKKIQAIRPIFDSDGPFDFQIGTSNDFQALDTSNIVPGAAGYTGALWGSGTWGTSLWTGTSTIIRSWRAIPDSYSVWKGLYLQVRSNLNSISYLGSEMLVTVGSSF